MVTSVTGGHSETETALSAQFGGTCYFIHGLMLNKPKFVNEGDICSYVRLK